jgi:cation transport regulator ChaB
MLEMAYDYPLNRKILEIRADYSRTSQEILNKIISEAWEKFDNKNSKGDEKL